MYIAIEKLENKSLRLELTSNLIAIDGFSPSMLELARIHTITALFT